MICLLPTSPRKIRNGRSAVTPRPLLNPTTMKGSGESMVKASSVKLSLEERKARRLETQRKYREANREKLKAANAKYRRDNKEKIAAAALQYRAANKEKIAEKTSKYYRLNKEKIARYNQTRYAENKSMFSTYGQKYRQSNKDKVAERQRKYRAANRSSVSANACRYSKERRQNDPVFKLSLYLRCRLRKAIVRNQKSGSAVRELGCFIKDLKGHLESLFDKNMTWENWGTYWHLDHIFPLAAANMEDRAEFLAVNNWRNLQPLEAKANLAKGDKVTPAARRLFNKLVKEFS